ncbi:TRAP transporter substrate-binding protein DctP [Alkalihalobacillus sp. MEB130]|uniref:TRAP transporter substrate-binding protein DctP n=1 Tax=Alkalihalobacillus sp. MEB130 TaxID=2976704 RepID=UPI0028DD69D4|nr:TRAP transporter substrate-binding protein DctP [Alkalihalobacillus sp. MEB130]MDT8862879.1 TRAP transporter substrate-binding protein DctP [Alkalihalobacillus sp. MEB130]
MKKIFPLLLAVVFTLITVACSSQTETGSEGSGESNDKYTLKLAGQSPEDHPSTQAMHKFAERIESETEGRIEIKVYPANQLGDYSTVYSEILRGTIHMGLISTPSQMDSRLALEVMPYLIDDYDDLNDKIGSDSYVFKKLQEINKEHGAHLLGFHANGFGGLGTSKEIQNLVDIGKDKDLLLRSPAMEVHSYPMEDIGFRITTIPFADLYTALQTGAADGWSGGEASLNYHGFRDVINYFYRTNDFFNSDSFYINDELWQEFDEEDQLIISEAANELMKQSFITAEEFDEKYVQLMEEEGIQVIDLSEDEIEVLRAYVRENTWDRLRGPMSDEIIDNLLESID